MNAPNEKMPHKKMIEIATFQPDIPQNLGALMRIGACFNAPLHVIGPCGFPVSAKSLRRAAMDYAALVEIHHHIEWDHFLETQSHKRIILMTTKGAENLWDFEFNENDIILMGRESAGVPDDVAERADQRVFIPMAPDARSLNIAVSAGIAVAEATRQLRTS